MSTPQPPYGHAAPPVPPYGAQPPAPGGYPAPPAKPRPGRTMPTIALICSIVGVAVVCLGFLSFLPDVGRVLGYSSFVGWGFLIAGLVLSIIALVKKAEAKGVSIAALIVSIAGGVVGVVAGIIVAIASVFAYTTTIIDEYGDLMPSDPDSGWSSPEGSADVQADCELLISMDPGAASSAEGVDAHLDDLAARMTTDDVKDPLENLADAYEDLTSPETPSDVTDASAALDRAAAELAEVCGVDFDGMP